MIIICLPFKWIKSCQNTINMLGSLAGFYGRHIWWISLISLLSPSPVQFPDYSLIGGIHFEQRKWRRAEI
jgi:hypothetical protein